MKTVYPQSQFKEEKVKSNLTLYKYNEELVMKYDKGEFKDFENALADEKNNFWINLDGVSKNEVHHLVELFKIHPLIEEDILTPNQRPKKDEIDGLLSCVIKMMYFDDNKNEVENEQVTFVLGKNFLLTFQDDPLKDHFDLVRKKLAIHGSRVRLKGVDFLMYELLDAIIDHYYIVIEKIVDYIEHLDRLVSDGNADKHTMKKINFIKNELNIYRRNVSPAKDLLDSLLITESDLIHLSNRRYFKDVYDHLMQAMDICDNYRDVIMNIRDLYVNQINLKTNEIMKFLAIVTTLLAPATVIGGIFGMNFDIIPTQHDQTGFHMAVAAMLIVPLVILFWLKRKKWL